MKKDDLKKLIQQLDEIRSNIGFLQERYGNMKFGEVFLLDEANDHVVDAMEALKTELVYNTKED